MIFSLIVITVNSDYCDYLRKFDDRVTYNCYDKELRPFVGILFTINNYKLIDLNKNYKNIELRKYSELLRHQLDWLNANKEQINYKALKLYNLYINNKLPINVFKRCCNFSLLEDKSKEYNKNNT